MILSGLYKLSFFSVLILMTIYSFSATYETDKSCKTKTDSIFYLVYNQEFGAAEVALIQSKNKLNPLIYILLTIDLFWWKTICSNHIDNFDSFENQLKMKLKNAENLNKRNYLEELIYLNYLIRITSIRNQYLKIPVYFIRLNSCFEKVNNSGYSVEEQNIFEIYKAIFNIGKSKYLLTKPGQKNDNIKILKKHCESQNIINKTIDCYFMAKIYSEIEKSSEQSLPYFNQLCVLYPENIIFQNELKKIKQKITK